MPGPTLHARWPEGHLRAAAVWAAVLPLGGRCPHRPPLGRICGSGSYQHPSTKGTIQDITASNRGPRGPLQPDPGGSGSIQDPCIHDPPLHETAIAAFRPLQAISREMANNLLLCSLDLTVNPIKDSNRMSRDMLQWPTGVGHLLLCSLDLAVPNQNWQSGSSGTPPVRPWAAGPMRETQGFLAFRPETAVGHLFERHRSSPRRRKRLQTDRTTQNPVF